MCDPTTFEASRLMYWPACSRDSNYVFASGDKPFVSADGILNQYTDWHDVTVWPQVPGEAAKAKVLLAKQADPTSKEGIVGAFCRTFNIYQAIEHFIPHAYDTTEHDDRLTYTGGSTVAGAVIYDGGNHVVWFGLNWSLELYQQANKRLHRQGQKEKVIIHHLVCEGTRDDDLIAALAEKDKAQEFVMQSLKARIDRVRKAG